MNRQSIAELSSEYQNTLKVFPAQTSLIGTYVMPGDKSITHRALILASLSLGKTILSHWLQSADCLHTMEALSQLGVTFSRLDDGKLVIHGVGRYGLRAPLGALDFGNSGTGVRLMLGVLAAQSFQVRLIGDRSLSQRPMQRVMLPLQQMGASFHTQSDGLPLEMTGNGNLKAIEYTLPVPSAQVKSALLLAGWCAQISVIVHEPIPCRDHTERLLSVFNKHCFSQTLHLAIPGDCSSAAFFVVLALGLPGSSITIKGVNLNPHRTGYLQILKAMGADIHIHHQQEHHNEPIGDLQVNYSRLSGIDVSQTLVVASIDEFPILFVAAAIAKGVTRFRGLQELKHKETNRLTVMAKGLQALGIQVVLFEHGIDIIGGQFQGGVVTDSDADHRVAMSFIVAGLLSRKAVIIKNTHAISTSFPDFVSMLRLQGFKLANIEV